MGKCWLPTAFSFPRMFSNGFFFRIINIVIFYFILFFYLFFFFFFFFIISVISRRPVHLSMLSWCSFYQYSAQYSFEALSAFPHNLWTVFLRGTNHTAISIINHWKEYWPSLRSNQRSPVIKSCSLPTELAPSE